MVFSYRSLELGRILCSDGFGILPDIRHQAVSEIILIDFSIKLNYFFQASKCNLLLSEKIRNPVTAGYSAGYPVIAF